MSVDIESVFKLKINHINDFFIKFPFYQIPFLKTLSITEKENWI